MRSKSEDKIVVAMLIALFAFAIGSGIGISVGFAQNENSADKKTSNNTTIVKNSTTKVNVSEVSTSNNTSKETEYETAVIYYSPEDLGFKDEYSQNIENDQ